MSRVSSRGSTRPPAAKKSVTSKSISLDEEYENFKNRASIFNSIICHNSDNIEDGSNTQDVSQKDFIGQSEKFGKQLKSIISNCFLNYQRSIKEHQNVDESRESLKLVLNGIIDIYFDLEQNRSKLFRESIKSRMRLTLINPVTQYFAITTPDFISTLSNLCKPYFTTIDRYLTLYLCTVLEKAVSEAYSSLNQFSNDIYEALLPNSIIFENTNEVKKIFSLVSQERQSLFKVSRSVNKTNVPHILKFGDPDDSEQEIIEEDIDDGSEPKSILNLFSPYEQWKDQLLSLYKDLESLSKTEEHVEIPDDQQSFRSKRTSRTSLSQTQVVTGFLYKLIKENLEQASPEFIHEVRLLWQDSQKLSRPTQVSQFCDLLTDFITTLDDGLGYLVDLYQLCIQSRDFDRSEQFEVSLLDGLENLRSDLQEKMDDDDPEMLPIGKKLCDILRQSRAICAEKGTFIIPIDNTEPNVQEDNEFITLDDVTFEMIVSYSKSIKERKVAQKRSIADRGKRVSKSQEQEKLDNLQCIATELLFPAYWNRIFGATLGCRIDEAEAIYREMKVKRVEYTKALKALHQEALDDVDIERAEEIDRRIASVNSNDNSLIIACIETTMRVLADNAIDNYEQALDQVETDYEEQSLFLEQKLEKRLRSIEEKQHIVELKNLLLQYRIDLQREEEKESPVVKEVQNTVRELMACKKYDQAKKLKNEMEQLKQEDLEKRKKKLTAEFEENKQTLMDAQAAELERLTNAFEGEMEKRKALYQGQVEGLYSKMQATIQHYKKVVSKFAYNISNGQLAKNEVDGKMQNVIKKVLDARNVEQK